MLLLFSETTLKTINCFRNRDLMNGFLQYLLTSLSSFQLRSGDSTARIWSIPEGRCKSALLNDPPNVFVLKHVRAKPNRQSNDVTTLDWNVSLIAYSNLNKRWLLIVSSPSPVLLLIFYVHLCVFQTYTSLTKAGKVCDKEIVQEVMFYMFHFQGRFVWVCCVKVKKIDRRLAYSF